MENKVPYIEYKPKDMSDEVWLTVIEAWENGFSDRETAIYILKVHNKMYTPSEIKKMRTESRDRAELCEMLKDILKVYAKKNVSGSLRIGDKESGKNSRWYLEHKCPEEFSTKSAVAFEGAVVQLSLEEKEKALKEMVENFKHGE